MQPRRIAIAGGGLALLALSVLAFYELVVVRPRPQLDVWLRAGIPLVLLLAALALLCWALFSDNIYNIRQGTVIAHHFEPAHMTPLQIIPGTPAIGNSPGTPQTIIPPMPVPDTWSLQLQDERGRTGWLNFSGNVFDRYPMGSYYEEQETDA